jgi:DeoR/GlpR family transcriptional regulator of sugar metabolism
MPARIEFNDEEIEFLIESYTDETNPWSMADLASELDVSQGTVRRTLEENGVTIRGRGRPAAQTRSN